MSLPTPHSIPWQARTLGPERDSRGRLIESWADPVGVPASSVYQPSPDDLLDAKNESPLHRRLVVLAPSWPGSPKDSISWAGVDWRQDIEPRDHGGGFHRWAPGVEVHFTRAEEVD